MVELSDKAYKKLEARLKELESKEFTRKSMVEGRIKLLRDVGERYKELNCLYEMDKIAGQENIALEEILNKTADFMPPAWRYPEITCCMISYMGKEYGCKECKEAKARLTSDIFIKGGKVGFIRVGYLEEKPDVDEGPFLQEERNLINSIAHRLAEIIERKQAEKKLRESHVNLSALLENTSDYILISDKKGFPVIFNSAYARIMKEALGIEMKPGLKPHKLLPDKKAVAWWDSLHRRVLKGEIFREVYTHDFGGGNIRHLEVSYHPIIEGGEVNGFTEVTRDITERKQAEEALKISEEKWRSLVENAPDVIMEVSRDGKIQKINRTVPGLSVEQVIGKNVADFMPSDQIDKAMDAIKKVFKTGEPTTYEVAGVGPQGSTAHYFTSVGPIVSGGKVLSTLHITRDITQRKRAEESLKENEERYRLILEASDAGVNLLNKDGIFLVVNSRAAEVWHKKPAEIIGKSLRDLGPPEFADECMPVFRRVLKTGRAEKQERFIAPLNKYFIEDIRPFRDSRGELVGVQVMTFDISSRKQAEKALEQKNIALREVVAQIEVEKNKLKDDVTANVDELLLPILKKLKLKGASRKYIDLLKRNLESLTSSFGHKISEKRFKLTPREIEICDMIKSGLTSKEISGFLGVSHQTIEKHRKNIREKLGIANKNINLTTFLQQL